MTVFLCDLLYFGPCEFVGIRSNINFIHVHFDVEMGLVFPNVLSKILCLRNVLEPKLNVRFYIMNEFYELAQSYESIGNKQDTIVCDR